MRIFGAASWPPDLLVTNAFAAPLTAGQARCVKKAQMEGNALLIIGGIGLAGLGIASPPARQWQRPHHHHDRDRHGYSRNSLHRWKIRWRAVRPLPIFLQGAPNGLNQGAENLRLDTPPLGWTAGVSARPCHCPRQPNSCPQRDQSGLPLPQASSTRMVGIVCPESDWSCRPAL